MITRAVTIFCLAGGLTGVLTAADALEPSFEAAAVPSATADAVGKVKTKEPAAEGKTAPKKDVPAIDQFPAPLDQLTGNISDLERTGYFTVTGVTFGTNNELKDLGLIWNVKVKRSLTCRHAVMLLDRFRDVRFYDTAEDSRFEKYANRMNYSSRIAGRAVDREMLKQDEQFQLWIVIDEVAVRMLRSESADTVVFGDPKAERPAKK